MDESPGILKPGLVGGGIMALLSWLPILNLGNCLCCMWILLGGAIGAYAYWKQLPSGGTISRGDGARVGLVSGIFGALFYSLLTYLMLAITGDNPGQGLLDGILNMSGEIPIEIEELLRSLQEEGVSPFFVFLGLILNLIIDSLFGLIGGVLTATILSKRQSSDPPVQAVK